MAQLPHPRIDGAGRGRAVVGPPRGGRWVRMILAQRPEPKRLAAALAPGVRDILRPREPRRVMVFERQLFDGSFRRISTWNAPGGGDLPAGAQALAGGHASPSWPSKLRGTADEAPPAVPIRSSGRDLLVPAYGFKDLHGYLEVQLADPDGSPGPEALEELLQIGQACGLSLEWSRQSAGATFREDALGGLIRFLGSFTHRLAEGVAILSPEGAVVHINRSAERMLGILGINAVGEGTLRILPAAAAQAVRQGITDIAARGRTAPRTVVMVSPEGGKDRWRVDVEGIRSRSQIVSYVATIRDLNHNDRLQRMVEMDRLKSDFLSTVSHELRTPLTTLRSYTWFLQQEEESFPEHVKDAVEAIDRESAGLCTLVENLLFLADPDHLRPEQTMPVPFSTVMTDVVSDYRSRAEVRKIRLVEVLPREAISVDGDPGGLRLLIGNIIDNAVKFSPEGGTVRVLLEKGQAKEVVLRVEDEGPGMPRLMGTSVFEPFQQNGDVLVGKPPGLGLGLAIVRRVAEEHGGKVDIDSKTRGGTRIRVTLPASEDPDA